MAVRGVPGKPPVATYQTRIRAYSEVDRAVGDAALSAYAELYGEVQRKLFAEVAAGRSAASLKNEYLGRYGMPARMFQPPQGVAGSKVSVKTQRLRLDRLRRQIAATGREIAKLNGRGRGQSHRTTQVDN